MMQEIQVRKSDGSKLKGKIKGWVMDGLSESTTITFVFDGYEEILWQDKGSVDLCFNK